VHDRRIDGETFVFGNAGALFMNAMTWWDRESGSIWSQPWGRAIKGDFKGVELFLLPSSIASWGSWRSQHPETLVMTNDLDLLGSGRQGFNTDFVIGVLIDGNAKAYAFEEVRRQGLINDVIESFPVLLWAAEKEYYVYLRETDTNTLTFRFEGDSIVDNETGSIWNIAQGRATEGPLAGQTLQALPSSSAFDWAWLDFYPQSEIYSP
jgi:hypothetical protein